MHAGLAASPAAAGAATAKQSGPARHANADSQTATQWRTEGTGCKDCGQPNPAVNAPQPLSVTAWPSPSIGRRVSLALQQVRLLVCWPHRAATHGRRQSGTTIRSPCLGCLQAELDAGRKAAKGEVDIARLGIQSGTAGRTQAALTRADRTTGREAGLTGRPHSGAADRLHFSALPPRPAAGPTSRRCRSPCRPAPRHHRAPAAACGPARGADGD